LTPATKLFQPWPDGRNLIEQIHPSPEGARSELDNRRRVAGNLCHHRRRGPRSPGPGEERRHPCRGQGIQQTLDCNDATLFVNGSFNNVTALGNCYAVTVMGSSNTVVADSVSHDITVYGYDQTVFYHNGTPFIWDRGRELGTTNRLQQVPG
jgi:hypothetical protein